METITVSSAVLALQTSGPLTPAMVTVAWEIAAALDEHRIPATVPNAVWLDIPTGRLRGEDGRSDNVWLRECLSRLTSIKFEGETRAGDPWGAVLVAEWRIEQGGALARILIPPSAVHALRASGTFAKIEIDAAHRLPPHARRLYGLLADRKRQREPFGEWSLDRLRTLLGVENKKTYQDWYQLRRWVLDPAIEAINEFGTVEVTMTPKKLGRSVVAARFDWKWKDLHDAATTVAETDRHSTARGKAQALADAPPLVEDEAAAWWSSLRPAARTSAALEARKAGVRVEGTDMGSPGPAAVLWAFERSDAYRTAYRQHELIKGDEVS